jgi:hypothetical protein
MEAVRLSDRSISTIAHKVTPQKTLSLLIASVNYPQFTATYYIGTDTNFSSHTSLLCFYAKVIVNNTLPTRTTPELPSGLVIIFRC